MLPERIQSAKIVTENLDGEVRFNSRDGLVNAHRHRLREVVGDAGDAGQFLVESGDQVFFRVKTLPRIHGTQQQVGVTFVDTHSFGGEVRPANLDDHVGDFGKSSQALFNSFADLD